jgi:hypothetical protein
MRYYFLIRRNRSIAKNLSKDAGFHHLIFHEGNISRFDQAILSLFSMVKLNFIDVSMIFKPLESHVLPEGSKRDLGYRLMCRFHYQQVWHHLADYKYAVRIDEDCVLKSLPKPVETNLMTVAYVMNEPHELTNRTLPRLLKDLDLESFYDHKFPYTNFFITFVPFWLQPDVQEFLQQVGENPESLRNRWGDLPVLGVALKAFGKWNADLSVDARISYLHLSHSSLISEGRVIPVKPSLVINCLRKIRLLSQKFQHIKH